MRKKCTFAVYTRLEKIEKGRLFEAEQEAYYADEDYVDENVTSLDAESYIDAYCKSYVENSDPQEALESIFRSGYDTLRVTISSIDCESGERIDQNDASITKDEFMAVYMK